MRIGRLSFILASALLACSASPSSPPATTTDADTGTTSDIAWSCAFVGEWALEKFECDTTDITSTWKAVVAETTYSISSGSDCHIVLTSKSPSCTEQQEFDWVIATDGKVISSKSTGITSCVPVSCTFAASDDPCVIGDRATSDDAGSGSESASLVKTGAKLMLTVDKPGDVCAGKTQHQTLIKK
jgi:hypothetical protein